MLEEISSGLNSGNAYYHFAQNFSSLFYLSKNTKVKIYTEL